LMLERIDDNNGIGAIAPDDNGVVLLDCFLRSSRGGWWWIGLFCLSISLLRPELETDDVAMR